MELDAAICPERLELLQRVKDTTDFHYEIVMELHSVAGTGCPETFEHLVLEARATSRHIKQAFKAYSDHLEQHGCDTGAGEIAALGRLLGTGRSGVLSPTQKAANFR